MKFKSVGTAGVDVFLLISGISLYFSMAKGISWKRFYVNRIKRLLLPTLFLTVPWFLYKDIILESNFHNFILNVTGISLFTSGNRTVWFVTAILICYIIYPFIYLIFRKTNHSFWALLITLALNLMFNYVLQNRLNPLFLNAEILFRRIPIFIIGAYLGKYVYEERELPFSRTQVAVGSLLFIVPYIYAMDLWRNPITSYRYDYIPLSIACTFLFSIMGNVNIFKTIFAFFGKITLEIYLSHENCLELLRDKTTQTNSIVMNLAAFALALVVSVIVMKIGQKWLQEKPAPSIHEPEKK